MRHKTDDYVIEPKSKELPFPKEKLRTIYEGRALFYCVDDFAYNMKEKLQIQQEKGFTGWDKPEKITDEYLVTEIKTQLNKEKVDYIDIANLVMFLWNRKDNYNKKPNQ